VNGCQKLRGAIHANTFELYRFAADRKDDLALLRLPKTVQVPKAPEILGVEGVSPGEEIIAVGFPLRGLLASSASVTTGVVSSLSGIGDDDRWLQFTAPVQPGNSGGPLLNSYGQLVGLVVAKLNALRIARLQGTLPENVNFAIKSSILREFLDSNGVAYRAGRPSRKSGLVFRSEDRLSVKDVYARAKEFTIPVECLGR
jgi:S1-C subfamily serine protease